MKATSAIPHDLNAESAVLGAILLDPSAIEKIVSVVSARDFFHAANQKIYSALQLMRMDSEPIDLITVTDNLRASGHLDQVGGAAYISELTSSVPTASNVTHYAGIVAECAKRREIMRKTERAYEQASDPSMSPAEITSELRECIDNTSSPCESLFTPWTDIPLNPPDWLISGIMERDTLTVTFGDSEHGKSLTIIDQACCIASGTAWHDHATKAETVVIIAGEGRAGIRKRIRAWEIVRGISVPADRLIVSRRAVGLIGTSDIGQLLNDLRGIKAGLVIIDTVARNFGDGDENSTADMTRFVAGCDKLRAVSGAAVNLAHHVGHGDKTRARGSIALRGAADWEYCVTKDDAGIIRFECTKSKDQEKPKPLAFRIRAVALDPEQITTSAVLEQTEYEKKTADRGVKDKGKQQRKMWKILADYGELGIDPKIWWEACEMEGLPKPTFNENKRNWLASGRIVIREYGRIAPGENVLL